MLSIRTNDKYVRKRGTEIDRKDELRSTVVGTGATIGANATIVCGHDIGRFAFIAAGAVVIADVPPYAVVAGCPARVVSQRFSGPDIAAHEAGQA